MRVAGLMHEQQQPPCKPSLCAKHTQVQRFLRLLWHVLYIVGKRKKKSGETARKGSKEALPRATEELRSCSEIKLRKHCWY